MSKELNELRKAVEQARMLIDILKAENERLRDENKRLRELVKDLEEELKEIGAVSWRLPDPEDPEVKDPDLMREDAHERKRLEKEYPWKE